MSKVKLKSFFADPAMIPGEDRHNYEAVEASFVEIVGPRDAMEWWWVNDCVDSQFGILRLRRAQTAIINLAGKEALQSILETVVPDEDVGPDFSRAQQASFLVDQWFVNRDSRSKIRAWMDRYDIDVSPAMIAQAIALRAGPLEILDRMITSLERRRDGTLNQIEARREVIARRRRAESGSYSVNSPQGTAPLRLPDHSAEKVGIVPDKD